MPAAILAVLLLATTMDPRLAEPLRLLAAHVDGLGTFAHDQHDPRALLLHRHHPAGAATYSLPWTGRIVRLVA